MNVNCRSIPLRLPEYWGETLKMRMEDGTLPGSIKSGKMLGEVLTYKEFKEIEYQNVFSPMVVLDNSPLRIIDIDAERYYTIKVEFMDNERGKRLQHMEDIGAIDLEKHCLAVPRVKGSLLSFAGTDTPAHEVITFDLLVREDMYRPPIRWLDMHVPNPKIVEFLNGCPSVEKPVDRSHKVGCESSGNKTIITIGIDPMFHDFIKEYDFDGDDRIKELLDKHMWHAELYDNLIQDLYPMENLNHARICTVDAK